MPMTTDRRPRGGGSPADSGPVEHLPSWHGPERDRPETVGGFSRASERADGRRPGEAASPRALSRDRVELGVGPGQPSPTETPRMRACNCLLRSSER
jgi:hypothetical protein